MKTVYLNDRISPNAVQRLKKHVKLVDNFDHPEEIDAIIVRQQYCTREIIKKVKNCKLIQMHGVGLERIDVEAAKEAGIPVSNVHGGNAQSVAELAVALILALSRKLTYINDGVRKGKFARFGLPETAFQSKLLVYDPFLEEETCKKLGFQKINDLKELFAKADFVKEHPIDRGLK